METQREVMGANSSFRTGQGKLFQILACTADLHVKAFSGDNVILSDCQHVRNGLKIRTGKDFAYFEVSTVEAQTVDVGVSYDGNSSYQTTVTDVNINNLPATVGSLFPAEPDLICVADTPRKIQDASVLTFEIHIENMGGGDCRIGDSVDKPAVAAGKRLAAGASCVVSNFTGELWAYSATGCTLTMSIVRKVA